MISQEQKRQAEQLYYQLGLDSVVNKVLMEFSWSLSGMNRVLDKIFGPYDIKGRAQEVAKQAALITYDSLKDEYHKEAVKFEAQIKSLEGQRDKEKANYDNLARKVTDIALEGYDELRANYYKTINKLSEVRNLNSQVKTLIRTLNKRNAHIAHGYESQIVDGNSKIQLLDSKKATQTTELNRLKSDYEKLKVAISTLTSEIPYDAIKEKLGQELCASLLKDSGLLDKPMDSREKHIDFEKYLGIAAEKGAKEASKYVEETMQKVIKSRIEMKEIEVILYTWKDVLSGSVYYFEGERFLDLLNDIVYQRDKGSSSFLELSNVNLRLSHGHNEILPTAHIKKADINMAVLVDVNGARGIGAKDGPKSFPFVPKSTLPIKFLMKDYMLIGKMHCARGQKPQDVLNQTPKFLPLNDVSIRPLRNNIEVTVPFAAVNKEQISYYSN